MLYPLIILNWRGGIFNIHTIKQRLQSFKKFSIMKTSRAECGVACRNDRLSAGLVGRLGVTFNARRSEHKSQGVKYNKRKEARTFP